MKLSEFEQEEVHRFEMELADDLVNLREELEDIKADFQVQRDHRKLVEMFFQNQQSIHSLD